MSDDELTAIEKEQLYNYLSNQPGGIPQPEEKFNIHTFLHSVATALDSTKVANLRDDELGTMRFPVRTFKGVSLIGNKIIGNNFIANFYDEEAEIALATSLSRDGFLIRMGVTSTRQVADITKSKKPNTGWFKKKEKTVESN